MKKFNQVTQEDGKFSRGIFPNKKYFMKCCDCGLIHELVFDVVKTKNKKHGGYFDYSVMDYKKYRVMFKARRIGAK